MDTREVQKPHVRLHVSPRKGTKQAPRGHQVLRWKYRKTRSDWSGSLRFWNLASLLGTGLWGGGTGVTRQASQVVDTGMFLFCIQMPPETVEARARVLVRVPNAVKRCTEMATLRKENIHWGGGLGFQSLSPPSSWWGARRHAGRRGAGYVVIRR